MLPLFLATLFLQFQGLNAQDANGIFLAEKVLNVERMMLQPGTIDFQVAPCNTLLEGAPQPQSGDATAPEWVRTAFHDFITANITAGTGGLDASVGFESGRPENNGTITSDGTNFIDRTIIGFNLFSSVLVSTSDFIALGLAEAVLSCDPNSPMMPLKIGRIDATQPGPFGVPGPSDSLASQTAAFANAGLSPTEMIQAVACGHSIGGIHNATFPQIVGHDVVIGASGFDAFDDTPFTFDNVGVQSYLSGQGKAGGPLVTTANTTFASDKRIFESDKNVTIKAMAATQATFEKTCLPLFAKMVNTVPKGVTLSAPIGPSKWITMHSQLDFTATNALNYSGIIGTFGKTAAPSTAAYQYGTVGGGNTGPKTSQSGQLQTLIVNAPDGIRFPFFGNTTYYPFNNTIDPSVTSISIESTYTEAINTNFFVVPSMSFTDQAAVPRVLVRVALLTTLSPAGTKLSATLLYPSGQAGSVSPIYKQFTFPLTSFVKKGAYTIFQGNIVQPPVTIPVAGFRGSWHIIVKLGSTQRALAQIVGNIGVNDFQLCTNSDLTTC